MTKKLLKNIKNPELRGQFSIKKKKTTFYHFYNPTTVYIMSDHEAKYIFELS